MSTGKSIGPHPDSVIAGLFRTISIDEQDVSINPMFFLICFQNIDRKIKTRARQR